MGVEEKEEEEAGTFATGTGLDTGARPLVDSVVAASVTAAAVAAVLWCSVIGTGFSCAAGVCVSSCDSESGSLPPSRTYVKYSPRNSHNIKKMNGQTPQENAVSCKLNTTSVLINDAMSVIKDENTGMAESLIQLSADSDMMPECFS